MKATKIIVEKNFEDDGLYGVTLWVDREPPRYLSISRDEVEEPDVIYFEAQDQICGMKTAALEYSLVENKLILKFPASSAEKFHWDGSEEVSIGIGRDDYLAVRETLVNIFSIK